MGGPVLLAGIAGAGTLIRYGDDADNCDAIRVQVDAGRGTALRLSQAGVDVGALDAIFFTHMHSDHTEGFGDIMLTRWTYNGRGPKLDVVCSVDKVAPVFGATISCKNYVAHIGDAFLRSGEVAQRNSENADRSIEGPAAVTNVVTFDPSEEPRDRKSTRLNSSHIPLSRMPSSA